MIYSATVTSQGQITIPAPVRKALGITKSKRVNFTLENKKAILEPEPDIMDFYGIFKTKKRIPYKKLRKILDEAWAKGEVWKNIYLIQIVSSDIF